MKRRMTVFALAAMLGACGGEQPAEDRSGNAEQGTGSTGSMVNQAAPGTDKAALVGEAGAAVKSLGSQLKGELKAALKSKGAAGAVEVCKDVAPELARKVSAEQGVEIKRVSLKNRNPFLGVPNAWQGKVLTDFEARRQAGEDPAGLSYSEVVNKEFRFMKAIPTEAVCLNCHGSEIKPEVAAQLAKYYPEDKATGFSEGDIRGAFVVTKSLEP